MLSGESQQVEKALKFVQDMFTNVDMHVVQLMLSKPLPDSMIKELQNGIGTKHNVDIQQVGFAQQPSLHIRGLNCQQA